jgi:translation initiation factor 2B subunit (eIF-2B alpha/beta/delta family)
MAIYKVKQVIDYQFESVARLDDLRALVANTQSIDGSATLDFPVFGATKETEYIHIVITENGPEE